MNKKRFWEIDFLRGIAVLMMIAYHVISALEQYGKITLDMDSPVVYAFGRSIGVIFLLLVGVSMTLSYSKGNVKFSNYLRRGAEIFALGMIITIVSWLFDPRMIIWFGVLHAIGVSLVLAYFFLKMRKSVALTAGSVIIAAGLALQSSSFSFPWLLWLGLKPALFSTYDYFPLMPYFGIVLIGTVIGRWFYSKKRSLPELGEKQGVKQVCFLGRHALAIYFIHVPLLLAALYLMG